MLSGFGGEGCGLPFSLLPIEHLQHHHIAMSYHTAPQPNLSGPVAQDRYNTLAARAIHFLWPWTQRTYPGLHGGMRETLGRAATWAAVRHWRSGYRPFPAYAARVMADTIEARARHGLALADDLRRHARDMDERPRPLAGCCAPRDVPGRIC